MVAFDLRDIFNFVFDSISISTRCRGAVAMTISLTTLTPKTSLVLILLTSLVLVGRKLLLLATRLVNGRSISGFSLSGVLIFFFREPVPLETPRIYFASA